MAIKDSFAPEEWIKVVAAPSMAGVAMLAVSPSGLTGLMAESMATANTMLELSASGTTALMQEIHTALKNPPDGLRVKMRWGDVRQAKQQAMTHIAEAVALVNATISPEEAQSYRAYLYAVAERVAGAALEGGVLGMGGVRVSEAEQSLLDEMKTAFRL
jgi:hypothetical protein